MKRLLLLTAVALSLLLFGIGPRDDPEAECTSYCRFYWASDPACLCYGRQACLPCMHRQAQYQTCLEDCGR